MSRLAPQQNQGPSPPVLSIVGLSGSGKTTLLEKVVRELNDRGYRLAVIKHHHHRGLQFDKPGTDTWRFAQAGADHVVLAGPDKAIHIRSFAEEPGLKQLASGIRGVDLIITEGYKHEAIPKIVVMRGESSPPPLSDEGTVVAVASDRSTDLPVPCFDIDDAVSVADFIERRFLRPSDSPT